MAMDQREHDKQLIKALYKYMLDNYRKSAKDKDAANQVVADVLDPNHEAEVDPDKIPPSSRSVMSKSKVKKTALTAPTPVGAMGTRQTASASPTPRRNVIAKDEETPKAPKAKKPAKLPSRLRVKGVKRLKNYMQRPKKANVNKERPN